MNVKKSFLLLASVSVLTLGFLVVQPHAGNSAEDRTSGAAPAQTSKTYELLNLFGDVFERVREEYVEPVEDAKLIEYALNGMLSNLDPHSSYMNEKEFKDIQVQNTGEFGGLGIEVTTDNGLVKVVSPIDDTPASRAGIQSGDLIIKIDNEATTGMALDEAVDKMRGKVGAPVTLTIAREGTHEPLKFTIVRDVIQIQSVKYHTEGNVGYIRITTFNQQTFKGLEKAFEGIDKELGAKLIGYVLDLRNNPGGLLDQAIAVSDAFIDQGEIVSTRGRTKDDTRRDNATPGDLAKGKPVVVLINGGSASASEIVAGALQDHKRAVLLGTQSFGKGSVQTIITIPGHGALRLTTARYYTPSGRSIQAAGIVPDITVERVRVVEEEDHSQEFKESDLKGALDKDKNKPEQKQNEEANKLKTGNDNGLVGETTDKTDKTGKKDPNKEKADEKKTLQDYQLVRALDLLQGLSLFNAGKNN